MIGDNKSTEAGASALAEDEAWFKNLFNLIPKSVYIGNRTSFTLQEPDSKKKGNSKSGNGKEEEKVSKKKRKRRNKAPNPSKGESPQRANLREKLNEKINEKRAARKADDEGKIILRAHRKRKRDERNAEREKEAKKARREQKFEKLKGQKEQQKEQQEGETEENDDRLADGDDIEERDDKGARVGEVEVETARLTGFAEEGRNTKTKRRKPKDGKLRELQLKLTTATRERALKEKVGEVTGGGKQSGQGDEAHGEKKAEVAKAVVDRELDKALQRVQGGEVRDDVKKLKKSIRMEKRKTEKSRENWAKRVESLQKEQAAKREHRAKNLKERKESKGKSSHTKPKKKITKTGKK